MENELLFQKRIEIMIDMAVKKYDTAIKRYEQELSELKQEIIFLKEGLSNAKSDVDLLRKEMPQKPAEPNFNQMSGAEKRNMEPAESLLKAKNGNFKSEDVSIEKFFYVGNKR